jgi:hypothetical protein
MPKITVHGGATNGVPDAAPRLASAPDEPAPDALELQAAAEAPPSPVLPVVKPGRTRTQRKA